MICAVMAITKWAMWLLGNTLVGDTWRVWRVLLVATMGEPLDADERELFKLIAGGREHEPDQRAVISRAETSTADSRGRDSPSRYAVTVVSFC